MSIAARMLRSLAHGISAIEEDLMQLDAEIAAEVERDEEAATTPEYLSRLLELLVGLPARLEYVAAHLANTRPPGLGFIMDDEAIMSTMSAADIKGAVKIRPRKQEVRR